MNNLHFHQFSQFLFSREELRQISRWFLLAGFLFRGVVCLLLQKFDDDDVYYYIRWRRELKGRRRIQAFVRRSGGA